MSFRDPDHTERQEGTGWGAAGRDGRGVRTGRKLTGWKSGSRTQGFPPSPSALHLESSALRHLQKPQAHLRVGRETSVCRHPRDGGRGQGAGPALGRPRPALTFFISM